MSNKNIDFKFYTDTLDLIKGENDQGEEVMKLCGIASREERDSQGEVLEIEGMDISSFIGGFVNWNHLGSKDPSTIIGQVTNAEKRDKELYVEIELFPELKMAQDAYNLTKVLEERKSKRRMQLSIEGRALERDSLDNGRVTKSKLTGIAMTVSPINAASLVQIMKGETDGLEDPIYDYKEDDKANGGNPELILDLTDENGNKITVTKDFKIKIEQVNKSLTTTSGEALIPESLDGVTKDLKKRKKINKSFENIDNSFIFKSKSDVFDYFFKSIDGIELNDAKQLYTFIETLQKKQNSTMADLTADKIQKAFEIIGVLSEQDIEKGGKDGSKIGEDQKTMGGKEDVIEKMSHSMKKMVEKGMSKEDIYKAMKEDSEEEMEEDDMEKAYGKAKEMAEKEEGKDKDDVKKSEDTIDDELAKAEAHLAELKAKKEAGDKQIQKSEAVTPIDNSEITDLIKSMREEFSGKLSAIGQINKAILDDNSELREKLEKSQADYDQLANQSQGRRSIQAQSYIEKGEDPELKKGQDEEVYSVTQHKKEIIKKAESLVDTESEDFINKGESYQLLKDADDFSYGKPITQRLVKALSAKGIKLTK